MPAPSLLENKIIVLSGGWSDEREISLDSGRACQKALLEAGFAQVDMMDVADRNLTQQLLEQNYDLAFVAMHGHYGEDGCVQGLLEVLHIPYTFSGVTSSAIAVDKNLSKYLYREYKLPVANDVTYPAGYIPSSDELDDVVSKLGLPLFVKPASNGSSYGVTKVVDETELADAIELASKSDCPVMVEAFVAGTEITVPVIGNNDAQALPVVEIVTGAEFYDVQVKYEPSELHHVIPARLDEKTYARAQELAVQAHKALGCRGVSRTDMIVSANNEITILETNTIPGMTETSLLPDSARHAGIEFPELCRHFVELALEDV